MTRYDGASRGASRSQMCEDEARPCTKTIGCPLSDHTRRWNARSPTWVTRSSGETTELILAVPLTPCQADPSYYASTDTHRRVGREGAENITSPSNRTMRARIVKGSRSVRSLQTIPRFNGSMAKRLPFRL